MKRSLIRGPGATVLPDYVALHPGYILGFLAMGAAKADTRGHKPWQMWLTITLVTLYGVLDELHQHFVPGRVADHYDVIADMFGGMFGVWVMYYLLSKNRSKPETP